MTTSMTLKIDGCAHTVKFNDDGSNVVVTELMWNGVSQRMTDVLQRKLTQAVTEVVDGEVEQDDVDLKHLA